MPVERTEARLEISVMRPNPKSTSVRIFRFTPENKVGQIVFTRQGLTHAEALEKTREALVEHEGTPAKVKHRTEEAFTTAEKEAFESLVQLHNLQRRRR